MCVSPYNSFLRVRQEPTLGPWKGSLSCIKCQLWWDLFFITTDILTTWGYSATNLPTNEPDPVAVTGTFCPWSPPDADNWPECPDRVRKKKVTSFPFRLFPLFNLSYPTLFFFRPGPGYRSRSEGPQLDLSVGAWSPPVGRELEFWVWSGIWSLVGPSSRPPILEAEGKVL